MKYKVKIEFINGKIPAIFKNVDISAVIDSIVQFFEKNSVNIYPFPNIVFDCRKQKSFLHFCIGVYDPDTKTVKIPIKDRSPNDVIRALFHEFIHHSQNMSGILAKKMKGVNSINSDVGLHKGLTKLEEDANARGFYMFRVWAREEKAKSKNPFYAALHK